MINTLASRESFHKTDIYPSFKPEEKMLIGRVITGLIQDGYLSRNGLKSNPSYSWTEKKKDFNPGRWIDQHIFTPAVKRAPTSDRPRERLLRLGPAELKTSELLAILVRAGQQGNPQCKWARNLQRGLGMTSMLCH